jgi:hypothetical protein
VTVASPLDANTLTRAFARAKHWNGARPGLLTAGWLHDQLWHDFGYRHVPNIGPLFVAQSFTGVVLGLLIVVVRRVWIGLVGIGFSAGTLADFLVSVIHGTLGFRESWAAPDTKLAFSLEVVALATLSLTVVISLLSPARSAKLK